MNLVNKLGIASVIGLAGALSGCGMTDQEAAGVLLGSVAPYSKDARGAAALNYAGNSLTTLSAAERGKAEVNQNVNINGTVQAPAQTARPDRRYRGVIFQQNMEYFFTATDACSDNDGSLEESDFGSVKTTFAAPETIYLSATLLDRQGHRCIIEVSDRNADKLVYISPEYLVRYPKTWYQIDKQFPAGSYKAIWKDEGKIIGGTGFEVKE